jgi:hypothetical protein
MDRLCCLRWRTWLLPSVSCFGTISSDNKSITGKVVLKKQLVLYSSLSILESGIINYTYSSNIVINNSQTGTITNIIDLGRQVLVLFFTHCICLIICTLWDSSWKQLLACSRIHFMSRTFWYRIVARTVMVLVVVGTIIALSDRRKHIFYRSLHTAFIIDFDFIVFQIPMW